MPSDPHRVAAEVAGLLLTRAPTLGPGRLVCVDGPAGSGKTTLAGALGDVLPDATVVHCDELLQGWRGLPGLAATVEGLVRPLAEGQPGTWRRWDWPAGDWAESHVVEPGGVLVLEGVGCWSPSIAPLVGVLAWVETESAVRLARGIERDGEQMRPHWEQWRLDEDALFSDLRTRDHADVVVDTGA